MKTSPFFLFSIFLLCSSLLQINPLAAQTKGDDFTINQWVEKSLNIDGKLDDWGDSLKNYNENTRFSYSIKNNGDMLYLAIKSQDKKNLNRILTRGISFSVNTEGKKKTGETVIFPILDRGVQLNKLTDVKIAGQTKNRQEQILTKITQIRVNGFADILDGPISMQNTYGISAAANFDDHEQMTVEIAIPFHLLKITDTQNPILCLIEINGIKPPKSTYNPDMTPRRNRRYGGYDNRNYDYQRGPSIDKNLLSAGFWVKIILAKKP